MSKAFTRESDDADDSPLLARQPVALPPGAKNYITADGAERLREELARLINVERPKLAGASDAVEARRQFQLLNQRIGHLEQSLRTATIVEKPPQPWDQVRFGATVTARDRQGVQSTFRMVGLHEGD